MLAALRRLVAYAIPAAALAFAWRLLRPLLPIRLLDLLGPPPRPPKTETVVLLVRHGQTDACFVARALQVLL